MRALIIGGGFGLDVHAPALAGLPEISEIVIFPGSRSTPQESKLRVITDWRRHIETQRPDFAIAAVPPVAQVDIGRALMTTGIPTLLEKPAGVASNTISDIANSELFSVGYSFRFMRGIQTLISQVNDGVIGKVRHIDVSWLTSGWSSPKRRWSWRCMTAGGGGVLRDIACHSLDYVFAIWPHNQLCVTAVMGQTFTTRLDQAGNEHAVTAPDYASVILQAPEGSTANLTFANALPVGQGHRIELLGTEGRLRWSHTPPFVLNAESLTYADRDGRENVIALPSDPDDLSDSRIPSVRRMLASCIRGDGKAASGIAAWRVLRLMETIEQANEQRRTLFVDLESSL